MGYEVKWDGYRIAIHKEPAGIRILTRGGHDWSSRFPGIVAAAQALPVGTAIIDGEAVVLDDQGRSDFNLLISSIGGRSGKKAAGNAVCMAFDLLYFDGHDLTRMELEERRHFLEELVGEEPAGGIRLSQEIETDDPAALLRTACSHDLEGIIAKDRTSPYRSGRGGEWVKIKCIQSEGFLVVGYEPSAAALGGIGRLLLAARKDDGIVYVAGVGTGFAARSGADLRMRMSKLVVERSPIGVKKKGTIWVEPKLVAEIEFRAWTGDGKLRHASYKGLRDAVDADDVYTIEDH